MNTGENMINKNFRKLIKNLDISISILPFITVLMLCVIFILNPESSKAVLEKLRFIFSYRLGFFYIILGTFVFFLSLYIAFSKYGKIKLGKIDKPEFSNFKWGSMMFTAGLAADILFYSLCEWILYADEPHINTLTDIERNAPTYALFHWGFIPWSFYMVLAVAFGFMMHIRNTKKQKYSESCRSILGKQVDKAAGKLIDLIAVFALIAGTATTFSLATPLLSMAISSLLGIPDTKLLTIFLLIIICIIYTFCAYIGMKGISRLASICTYLFFILLIYVLLGGNQYIYIIKRGLSSIGRLSVDFLGLALTTRELRNGGFSYRWTVFYWSYWIVWCVATPFFIGAISKGRTIKQVILGGYFFGILGTYISFIVLGNYGLVLKVTGIFDANKIYHETQNIYLSVVGILNTLPFPKIVLIILVLTMIAFYATTFDSLTMVAATYSYKSLNEGEEPDKRVRLFWSLLLILLPIGLIFSESSMANLQTVSILAAFPIGIIMIIIIVGFFKEADRYIKENKL